MLNRTLCTESIRSESSSLKQTTDVFMWSLQSYKEPLRHLLRAEYIDYLVIQLAEPHAGCP
jgi:hypothetical protein